MNNRIFVVEDDSSIRELVKCTLESSGHEVFCFESGEEMFPVLKNMIPNLFILDIMLPGINGIEILKSVRSDRKTSAVPVIMLTAKATELDLVKGLDSGANDYIAKPFGVLELMARVRAALRTGSENEKSEYYKSGPLELFMKDRTVKVNGQTVELTLKEFELIRQLIKNAGQVMERDTLLSKVWGIDFVGESRTLDMHIKTLRKKIGDDASNQGIIRTVRGVGYIIDK